MVKTWEQKQDEIQKNINITNKYINNALSNNKSIEDIFKYCDSNKKYNDRHDQMHSSINKIEAYSHDKMNNGINITNDDPNNNHQCCYHYSQSRSIVASFTPSI